MNLINKIGLGTVQFGMDYGISNSLGKTPVKEVKKILEYASKKGVLYLDTASAYGISEKVLGENDLQNFKVVSKFLQLGNNIKIEDELNKSLNNLKVDHLYSYLAHRPMELLKNKKTWEKLLFLKQEKKINKIGFSLNSPKELELLLQEEMIPDLIQVPYNYFDNRFKNHLIELKEKGCEIHTRSAFLQGLFFSNVKELPPFFDKVKKVINELQCEFEDKLSSVLLKYVLSLNFIDIVIMGVENKDQLKKNLSSINSVPTITHKELNLSDNIIMPLNWPK